MRIKFKRTLRLFFNMAIVFFVVELMLNYYYFSVVPKTDAALPEIKLLTRETYYQKVTQRLATSRVFLPINCQKLIAGEKSEVSYAQILMRLFMRKATPNEQYPKLTGNCTEFTQQRGYIMEPGPSEEERKFPIAFSILAYQHVDQIEQLLRIIYRPQNLYCLHVDKNSAKEVFAGVSSIVSCLPNVILATKRESIVYAGFSRLQADLNCMKDALNSNVSWKYIINLSAEMFPLRTNRELVQILKIYNGTNDIEGIAPDPHAWRWTKVFNTTDDRQIKKTDKLKEKPPFQITITKGSAYGALTRDFVQYALHDPWAKGLLEWMRDTYSPDEQFFPTLHNARRNPHMTVPGSYKGDYSKNKWMAVYAHWFTGEDPCTGRNIRGICMPNVIDLPRIVRRKEMFLNKLKPFDDDFVVLHCLTEWLQERVKSNAPFDLTEYHNLPFVREKREALLAKPVSVSCPTSLSFLAFSFGFVVAILK